MQVLSNDDKEDEDKEDDDKEDDDKEDDDITDEKLVRVQQQLCQGQGTDLNLRNICIFDRYNNLTKKNDK